MHKDKDIKKDGYVPHFVMEKVGNNSHYPSFTNNKIPPSTPPPTPKAMPPGYIHHPNI
jgi:hypothetical protein